MQAKQSELMDSQFQFTHPGGVRLCASVSKMETVSFNSRTREGCDPTKVTNTAGRAVGFNSRTREGCDCGGGFVVPLSHYVSIHAPGRGATGYLPAPLSLACCFNSRTREGCDLGTTTDNDHEQIAFQFTHPGGVRRWPADRRGDRDRVSIHAPGRGATSLVISDKSLQMQFQFTHPGGVRLSISQILFYLGGFNSRTREGCDTARGTGDRWRCRFQFTHPGGVRLSSR